MEGGESGELRDEGDQCACEGGVVWVEMVCTRDTQLELAEQGGLIEEVCCEAFNHRAAFLCAEVQDQSLKWG